MVTAPMELMGIDFIGPFPAADESPWFILLAIDYFSRGEFCTSPDTVSVQRLLTRIFNTIGRRMGIYTDPGSYFGNCIKDFASSRGVTWCTSPFTTKKATGMAEEAVDIVQRIIKKHSHDLTRCKAHLEKALF